MSCTRALIWLAGLIVLSIVLHTSSEFFLNMQQGYGLLFTAGPLDAHRAGSCTVCPVTAFVALVVFVATILLYTYSASTTRPGFSRPSRISTH